MSIHMPTTIKEERLRWVLPIVRKEIKLIDAAKVCPHSKRSLERWVAVYKRMGEAGLIPHSTRPKTNSFETPVRVKERILEIRGKTGKCALKIKWDLEKEGIQLNRNTVHKVIKTEGLVRRYRVRKLKYKYVKVPLQAGELVEIDIKFVPRKLFGKRYYQFTAIDCATRWRLLEVHEYASNHCTVMFLKSLLRTAPFRIRAIKTDNGYNFTNRYVGYEKSTDPLNPRLHAFDILCQQYNIIHYLIDPGKPAQNGMVERSHRSDQETFYDRIPYRTVNGLKVKLKQWNDTYNNLQHCGLGGKTPNQMLRLANINLPPKVPS
jgi:hypothetical protein